jgi:hypothetical protein
MLPYVPLQRIPASELPALPACESDPFWANVVLFADGETLTDSSSFARATTVVGTAALDSENAILKPTSYKTTSSPGSRIQWPASTDFNLKQQYTIDFWIRPTASSATSFVMGDNGNKTINWTAAGGILTITNWGGANLQITGVALDQWTHIAFSRDSTNTIRAFKNGVLASSGSGSTLNANTPGFAIFGLFTRNDLANFVGNLTQVRFTQNVCRYAAPFTPPTLASCGAGGGEDPTPVPAPSPDPGTLPPSGDQYIIAPAPRTLRVGTAISAQEIARVIGFGTSYFTGNTETMAGVTLEATGLPPGVGSLALSVYSANPAAILITASGTPTTEGDYRATVNLIRDGGIVGSFIWQATVIDPPVFAVNEELDPSTYRADLTVGVAADILIASPTLDRAGTVTLTFVPSWITAIGMTLALDWTSGTPGSGELRLTGTPTRALNRNELVSPGFVLGGQLLTTTSFYIRCIA